MAAIIWTAPRRGEEGSVGHVRTTLTVTNHLDQFRADEGSIKPEQIRSVTLDNVLVDTGATLLGLPVDVIERLGLPLRSEMVAQTAAGPRPTRRFRDADVTLMGRTGTFDCTELPVGSPCLLGVTPLETLGIEPDVRNHALRLLPDGPDETYILAL